MTDLSDYSDYRFVGVREIQMKIRHLATAFLHKPLSLVNKKGKTAYVFSFDAEGYMTAQMFVTECNRLLQSQPYRSLHEDAVLSFELTDRLLEADIVVNLRANSLNSANSINRLMAKAKDKRTAPAPHLLSLFSEHDRIMFRWAVNLDALQKGVDRYILGSG